MEKQVDKKVQLDLVGTSDDAFVMITRFLFQARKEGWNFNEVSEVMQRAQQAQDGAVLKLLLEYCEQPPLKKLLPGQSN